MTELPLQYLDLSETDEEIYRYLLKNERESASSIASSLGRNRSFLYERLEKLEDEGLVQCIKRAGKNRYSASPPSFISNLLQQRAEEAKQLVDEYVENEQFVTPTVESYTSRKAIQAVLHACLERTDELLLYGNITLLEKEMSRFMSVWHAKRAEQIDATLVLSPQQVELSNAEVKLLKQQIAHNQVTAILPNKVVMLWWAEEPLCIVLNGNGVYEAYYQFFHEAWQQTVTVRHGVEGIRYAWMSLLRETVDEVQTYGLSYKLTEVYGRQFGDNWQKKRRSLDIDHRVIGTDDEKTRTYIKSKGLEHQDMTIRFLDKLLLGPMCVATNGDIAVSFLYTEDNHQAIVDTESEAVHIHMQRFEELWKEAKE